MTKRKNNPHISIIIPSYNKGVYIGKTLSSIFSQSYKNFEVIIQDGGSTDNTLKVVKKFQDRYKNVYWESIKDKGQCDAINKGITKVKGDIITYINADDVYEKDAFKYVKDAYLKNASSYWFVGKGRVIDKDDNEIAKFATAYKNFLLRTNKYCCLLMTNYLMQPSVFLRREVFEKFGKFSGTKDFVMEYDLWLKIGKDKMPIVINTCLSSFRITKGTITKEKSNTLLKEDEKIIKKYTNNIFLLFTHKLHNKIKMIIEKFV